MKQMSAEGILGKKTVVEKMALENSLKKIVLVLPATVKKIVLVLPAILLLAFLPAFAQGQAGSLVFSLKFSGNSLEVQSVSLVPGAPPDYFVEPESDWLRVGFYGEGQKMQEIKVPDPRKIFLEVVDEARNISGVRVFDENAPLVFTAPNNPGASRAEIFDENGSRLLTLDYRRALKIEEETLAPQAQQFEPQARGPDLLPLAIAVGLAGLGLAYYALRKPREPPPPSPDELEKSLDEFLQEEQNEKQLPEPGGSGPKTPEELGLKF